LELVGQKMIRRKQAAEQEKSALQKRIEKIETPELLKWVDQALFAIGRNLNDWHKNSEFVYLEEAKDAADALNAVVEELINRNKGSRNL